MPGSAFTIMLREATTGDLVVRSAAGSLYLLQSRPITALGAAAEFTVEWDDPADAALTWTREDVHMDACRPCLSCDFVLQAPAFGLDKANDRFGPPARVRYRGVHGYMYAARAAARTGRADAGARSGRPPSAPRRGSDPGPRLAGRGPRHAV